MATAPAQPIVAARTSPEKKAKFAALAASRGMSESSLLSLLMETVLEENPVFACAAARDDGVAASERVSLRLRRGDRRHVDARAAARNMKTGSYLVALIRAHVRRDAPLPAAELNALKMAVGQLSAVGRNLNKIAHASHLGAAVSGDLAQNLHATVVRVDEVRRYVSDVVRGNLMSWEAGDA